MSLTDQQPEIDFSGESVGGLLRRGVIPVGFRGQVGDAAIDGPVQLEPEQLPVHVDKVVIDPRTHMERRRPVGTIAMASMYSESTRTDNDIHEGERPDGADVTEIGLPGDASVLDDHIVFLRDHTF